MVVSEFGMYYTRLLRIGIDEKLILGGWMQIKRLGDRGFDVNLLGTRVGPDGEAVGEGKLKVSFYGSGGVKWTDKPGLIEDVRGA